MSACFLTEWVPCVQVERWRGAWGRKRCPALRLCPPLPPHPDPKPSDLHPEGPKSFPPNPQQPGPRASAHPGSPRQRARSDSAREPRPGAGYWRGQGRPRKDPGAAGRTEGVGRGGKILGDPVSCKILGGEGLRPSSFRSAPPRREGGRQGGLARAKRRRQGALAGRRAAAHLGRGGSCEVAHPGQVPVLPWVQSFTSRPLVGSEGVRLPSPPRSRGALSGALEPIPRQALRKGLSPLPSLPEISSLVPG